jgi:hypothetical protein
MLLRRRRLVTRGEADRGRYMLVTQP